MNAQPKQTPKNSIKTTRLAAKALIMAASIMTTVSGWAVISHIDPYNTASNTTTASTANNAIQPVVTIYATPQATAPAQAVAAVTTTTQAQSNSQQTVAAQTTTNTTTQAQTQVTTQAQTQTTQVQVRAVTRTSK
jgi:hypothetical protein